MNGRFPEVVLLEIFSSLSIQELGRARRVCKQWNNVVRSDVLWQRFIPKWKGFVAPTKTTAFQTVVKMWQSSVRIGNERWFPHPMPELVRYESRLRKAENHNFYKRNSTTTLFLRLNPCYDFTTKGKDLEDAKMKEVCSEIWDRFRDKDENILEMKTYEDAMKRAKVMSRKEAMNKLLDTLEPQWFLEGLGVAPYQLDDDGEILGERSAQDDEEVQEDDLGDVTQCTQTEGIFGSFRDYTAWVSKVNKRLPVHLYCQLKAFFADRSKNFLEYFLSDGCFNENYEYAYSLVISDTAAFHIKQFYEL